MSRYVAPQIPSETQISMHRCVPPIISRLLKCEPPSRPCFNVHVAVAQQASPNTRKHILPIPFTEPKERKHELPSRLIYFKAQKAPSNKQIIAILKRHGLHSLIPLNLSPQNVRLIPLNNVPVTQKRRQLSNPRASHSRTNVIRCRGPKRKRRKRCLKPNGPHMQVDGAFKYPCSRIATRVVNRHAHTGMHYQLFRFHN